MSLIVSADEVGRWSRSLGRELADNVVGRRDELIEGEEDVGGDGAVGAGADDVSARGAASAPGRDLRRADGTADAGRGNGVVEPFELEEGIALRAAARGIAAVRRLGLELEDNEIAAGERPSDEGDGAIGVAGQLGKDVIRALGGLGDGAPGDVRRRGGRGADLVRRRLILGHRQRAGTILTDSAGRPARSRYRSSFGAVYSCTPPGSSRRSPRASCYTR